MVRDEREQTPADGEVVVRVSGCGVCHTDLGFLYEGVPTRHPFPLTLGHEISGTVVETGPGTDDWANRAVVVPAVIPCCGCAACAAGHGSICPQQIFPGNDVHGGFATHVTVPAKGLCPVPDLANADVNPAGLSLSTLSVIADAVSTPYQAILRAGIRTGDLAVFIGVGGVGSFGVQIAAALGAHVVAVDTNPARLESVQGYGADLLCNASDLEFRDLKAAIKAFAAQREVPSWRWRIFETSGTTAGQASAFGLMTAGSYLSIVGFTRDKIQIRLSNLMAHDATIEGNWGCLPEHYPAVVDMALAGKINLNQFVEHRSMETINETFEDVRAHRVSRRIILTPEHQ